MSYFYNSTWNVIGLEIAGLHYHKAIQSAMRIRKSLAPITKLRYAYYASENPLETGFTLPFGSLGKVGVVLPMSLKNAILNKVAHQQ